ncbi:hypothetical protein [Elstera cyanobacteriorum]|uniref:hypothetical protein n=1 Tax=Elstera cyanobacteriorum TaxID=2022747 RepID=UPI002353A2F8|nr:hypothetical protein [Elstera cyanobacteriorum]MCK6443882.1 hypothetical protein [Elstera cyanobacteriorum]
MARQELQTPGTDLARLAKLLARLDSDQDAEVLAAARAASRLLRVAGLGWDDVISAAPGKGWRGFLDLGKMLAAETKRRIAAERAAHHWQTLARLREAAVKPDPMVAPAAAAPSPTPEDTETVIIEEAATGHPLIDRLLAAPGLDAAQRRRVEAIASWYRRSGDLLETESHDLEAFGQQVGLIPQYHLQRVAA